MAIWAQSSDCDINSGGGRSVWSTHNFDNGHYCFQTVTVRLAGSGLCQMFALAADSSSGACALVKLLKGLLIRIEILIIEMAPA